MPTSFSVWSDQLNWEMDAPAGSVLIKRIDRHSGGRRNPSPKRGTGPRIKVRGDPRFAG